MKFKILAGICLMLGFLGLSNLYLYKKINTFIVKIESATETVIPVIITTRIYDPEVDRVPIGVTEYDINDLLIYIEEQCRQTKINKHFALSLLREENPNFFRIIEDINSRKLQSNVFSVRSYLNSNGTYDYGLWQLNGQYLWNDFIPRFWHYKTEFDWTNPYHNSYIAIRHIRWIYDTISRYRNYLQPVNSVYWETAIAYNSGIGRILEGSVPEKSLDYAMNVMSRIYP